MKLLLSLIAALVVLPAVAEAQTPWPGAVIVQRAPYLLDACTATNATGAVNNTATVTLTPPTGQYVYICGIDLTVSNDATGAVVSTNLSFTSTNLGWGYKFSAVNTANTTSIDRNFYFANPIRSLTAGTAVTVVSPAVNLHAAYSINVYYYFSL